MRGLLFLLFFLPLSVVAAEYHIGDGQAYTTIGAAPWSSLAAGDTVYIHPGSYPERLYVSAALQGTEQNPIRIIGISDGQGNQPTLDGSNSTTGPNFAPYGSPEYHSLLGLLFIGPGSAGANSAPRWVEIKNLRVQNYRNVTTTDELGVVHNNYSGSAVYIQGGEHITLDGLTITGGTDGIFAKDGTAPVRWINLRNSYVYGNGVSNNYLYHNVYTEVKYLTLEFNHFGPPMTGSPGNNIKDRSAGAVIRYNWIEDGGHILDLVECQDLCADHTADPTWDTSFVYGNVLYAGPSGPGYLVHLGTGDAGAAADRWRKKLYFYNNTVVVNRNQSTSYYVALFQLSGSGQSVYMDNNLVHVTPQTVGQTPTEFCLQFDGSNSVWAAGNITLGKNWISPGWRETRSGYTLTGTVTGQGNIISPAGNDPGFDGDYRLATGSNAIGVAGALPSLITTGNGFDQDFTPTFQYVKHQGGTARASLLDLGAFESGLAPSPTCSDGVQNQGETGIDCGGPCAACGGGSPVGPKGRARLLPPGTPGAGILRISAEGAKRVRLQ